MFTDITLAEGDCFGGDELRTIFENMQYLRDCSQVNNQQFVCKQITESQSGSIRIASSTEMCFPLQTLSGVTNPNVGTGEEEQKLLLFTRQTTNSVSIPDSSNAAVRPTRSARVLCNGETIATLTAADMSGSFASVAFECPANSDIELCFDSQLVVVSGQPGLASGTQEIKICAALICLTTTENAALEGFFVPEDLDYGCCFGREALHLALQNATALRSAFASFGQVPGCNQFVFEDQDDHVLENDVATTTDFLIVGTLQVCGVNSSKSSPAIITAEPVFTCGETRINCLDFDVEIPPVGDSSTTRTVCLEVPVLACGQCAPGDSLTSSVRSQFVCNQQSSQVVEGIQAGISSITQDYCVYTFKRLSTDFGDELQTAIGECIEEDQVAALLDTLEAVRVVCENPTPITLQTGGVSGVAARDETVVISPAQPWPPLNDPTNPNPPPVKKVFLTGYVRACRAALGGLNFEDARLVSATATVTCGGVELAQESVGWRLTDSGSSQRCGSAFRFRQCVSCPIDEDLSVTFTSAALNPHLAFPNEFTYEFDTFCF